MGAILLLLALCVVMAVASFLAGALPLSMTLSQSQLRLISSIGVGILVGTSLIVIIPEGIEAVASTTPAHSHSSRAAILTRGLDIRWGTAASSPLLAATRDVPVMKQLDISARDESGLPVLSRREDAREGSDKTAPDPSKVTLPTFYIGFSLMLGFVLMFLIDRLPRHATETLSSSPATRHISLDDLSSGHPATDDDDGEVAHGYLGSLAPTPKQSRSLATTTGLVIHAAADGIAMGASATTENMELGLIIFVAIMVHKAPAAFGLTSLLLRQGLSKRAARGHLIVFSLAAPVGALATYMLLSALGGNHMEGEAGQWWTGMLLLFSGGTFLYVAMHAMQEDATQGGHEHQSSMNGYTDGGSSSQRKQSKPQMRDTVATVVGMLLPLLTQFGHHHH